MTTCCRSAHKSLSSASSAASKIRESYSGAALTLVPHEEIRTELKRMRGSLQAPVMISRARTIRYDAMRSIRASRCGARGAVRRKSRHCMKKRESAGRYSRHRKSMLFKRRFRTYLI